MAACFITWSSLGLSRWLLRRPGPPATSSRVDVLDRVYPDQPPPVLNDDQPISVPRGGGAAFQFAATSSRDASCTIDVGPLRREDGKPLKGRIAAYRLLPHTWKGILKAA